jgi:hypothetical protein
VVRIEVGGMMTTHTVSRASRSPVLNAMLAFSRSKASL